MNVKDGYLFPLVFEDSCDCRYTAYVDDNTFRFVSNQSGEVWTNDSKFSFEQFKIYVKDGSWKILTPQFGQITELTEAYAKIDTLESALEDAVKEILSLKHQLIAKAANTCLGIEKEESEFKPISEMTLEDWELAKREKWLFADNHGDEYLLVENVTNTEIYFDGYSYPFTVNGVHTREPEDYQIIKRIR